eukprot:3139849-Pyramimonas_sp.AAC.1
MNILKPILSDVGRKKKEEEGDPGRGGLQGTRPRAEQLGGPASHGLSVCTGSRPLPPTTPSLSPLSHYTYWILFSKCLPRLSCWPSTSLLSNTKHPGSLGTVAQGGPGLAFP